MEEKTIFLAFDYGTRNIGVAVGQKITKSATALPPLVAKNRTPPWNKIDNLIKNWQPKALIVGVPYKINGGNLAITKLAQNFIKQLKKRYNLPVYAAEEHLTTKAAREEIFKQGGYRALQKESVDSMAAKIIFEEWVSKKTKI
ncbi:MAG: Holliday junction resolvase RuvX [Coxiellaceae bacterium]|jgi:putative Holliday junction resolvase|nr:Holliday junction resolvase RuvX [Coxiellaceae bacterium]